MYTPEDFFKIASTYPPEHVADLAKRIGDWLHDPAASFTDPYVQRIIGNMEKYQNLPAAATNE